MTDITVTDDPAVERTVRLAATGDEVAFTRLVDEHHAPMARVACAIGRPRPARFAVLVHLSFEDRWTATGRGGADDGRGAPRGPPRGAR